jgi:hypothetical protein
MSLRLLRAELWARDDVKKLHRVTVRSVPDGRIDGPAVIVMSRLVITGANHHRLHEELTQAGGYLRETSFRREERISEIRQWLEASTPTNLNEGALAALRSRFETNQAAILAAVETRSKDRLRTLTNTIETRKRKEADDIRQVLDDLEIALKAEIAAEQKPEQLSLFSEDERTQLKRDLAALESRLARIPREREQELEAIEERYSRAVEHTFPVAVIFLVPASFAAEKNK